MIIFSFPDDDDDRRGTPNERVDDERPPAFRLDLNGLNRLMMTFRLIIDSL